MVTLTSRSGLRARDTKVFHTLNGMRGVAAIAVVMRHAPGWFGFDMSSTFLAVDMFFVLSGFVLAHAYEARFESGMGVTGFMRLRFQRLFPLFWLGIAISLFHIGAGWALGAHISWTPASLAFCAAFNILFLPAPELHGADLFPLNVPGWSLFLELFVNLLYVLSWRWLSNRVLVALLSASTVALCICAMVFGGLAVGWTWSSFVVGLARVLYSFPAGVLIYRMTRDLQPTRLNGFVAIAAMLLIFILDPGTMRIPYDVVAVVVVLPVIVAVASLTRPTRTVGLFTFLGAISYGLYAIHAPFIDVVNGIVARLAGKTMESYAPWLGMGLIAVMVGIVWLLDRHYDKPLRRWLSASAS